ncbi:hypothetical protein BD779DRAFT_1471620 [Infundibulicybe gibba]|nr:hypothetical protein BD779DRAFT_1471620 [Infundibulicybe gibba]
MPVHSSRTARFPISSSACFEPSHRVVRIWFSRRQFAIPGAVTPSSSGKWEWAKMVRRVRTVESGHGRLALHDACPDWASFACAPLGVGGHAPLAIPLIEFLATVRAYSTCVLGVVSRGRIRASSLHSALRRED